MPIDAKIAPVMPAKKQESIVSGGKTALKGLISSKPIKDAKLIGRISVFVGFLIWMPSKFIELFLGFDNCVQFTSPIM